jgi:hypothetical protein
VDRIHFIVQWFGDREPVILDVFCVCAGQNSGIFVYYSARGGHNSWTQFYTNRTLARRG